MTSSTPLPIIAQTSLLVTKIIDRITGDRNDFPLFVCSAIVEALEIQSIRSSISYGHAAWIELLDSNEPMWAGCWGEHNHFWVVTEFQEVIDLNTAVSYRRIPKNSELKAKYSSPLLWSREIPQFYRYEPQGYAEFDLTEPRDQKWFEQIKLELKEKLKIYSKKELEQFERDSLVFPNEAMICPDRMLLDDTKESFKHFDRALSIYGIPEKPF